VRLTSIQLSGFSAAAAHSLNAPWRLAARTRITQVVLRDFSLQCVAMDAQKFAGGRAVPIRTLDGARDECFLQDLHGFFKKETAFEQVIHEPFKCFFHSLVLH